MDQFVKGVGSRDLTVTLCTTQISDLNATLCLAQKLESANAVASTMPVPTVKPAVRKVQVAEENLLESITAQLAQMQKQLDKTVPQQL